LLEEGHEVIALSRNCVNLQDLKDLYPGLHAMELDISSEAGRQEVISYLKVNDMSLDGIVHNAGMLLNKPFSETTPEDMMQVYKVNVFSVAELTRILLPSLNPGAHIVAISSMGGIQGSMKFAGLAAYSSSKGALITLMELLAEEYKEESLFFNTLALGAVQTEMLSEAFPGYQASVSPEKMGTYVARFVLNGQELYNGKVLQVSNSTP
jgi:NAD(P)-dependent dehydrogenase (short-subunit alcohol dehydrogenase family)